MNYFYEKAEQENMQIEKVELSNFLCDFLCLIYEVSDVFQVILSLKSFPF